MPEKNSSPSKWKLEINGKELPVFMTPLDKEHLWVKVGQVQIDQLKANMNLRHATAVFSVLVDAFLLTDDAHYIPAGPLDYKNKSAGNKLIIDRIKKAAASKNIAELKALLIAAESNLQKQ